MTGVTTLQGNDALAVEINHARDSHTGVLRWDQRLTPLGSARAGYHSYL